VERERGERKCRSTQATRSGKKKFFFSVSGCDLAWLNNLRKKRRNKEKEEEEEEKLRRKPTTKRTR